MGDNFNEDESFFRGIHKDQCDPSIGKVFSSAFKDSLGVSVDRSDERNDQECVTLLRSRRNFFAVAKVTVTDVVACEAHPKYCPIDENEYHSEIHDTNESVSLNTKKARCVSGKSNLVFLSAS
jgi:hypothetical protein